MTAKASKLHAGEGSEGFSSPTSVAEFLHVPESPECIGGDAPFDKVDGLEWLGPYAGRLVLGTNAAEVRMEPNDDIRISFALAAPLHDEEALRQNELLPGNVRFARMRGAAVMTADSRVNGRWHLNETFRRIRAAMDTGAAGTGSGTNSCAAHSKDPAPAGLEAGTVDEALGALSWAEDAVVAGPDGWELRIPMRDGRVVPVRMTLDESELKFERVVLDADAWRVDEGGCSGAAHRAVADQALRLNARIRHARFALADDRLVIQTRLHAGQVEASWLELAASAVAFGWNHARLALRVLAHHPDVATRYWEVLCSTGEQTTSADVDG